MVKSKPCWDCSFVHMNTPMCAVDKPGFIKSKLKSIFNFFNINTKKDLDKVVKKFSCHIRHDEPLSDHVWGDCAGFHLFADVIKKDSRPLHQITEVVIIPESEYRKPKIYERRNDR